MNKTNPKHQLNSNINKNALHILQIHSLYPHCQVCSAPTSLNVYWLAKPLQPVRTFKPSPATEPLCNYCFHWAYTSTTVELV